MSDGASLQCIMAQDVTVNCTVHIARLSVQQYKYDNTENRFIVYLAPSAPSIGEGQGVIQITACAFIFGVFGYYVYTMCVCVFSISK